MNTYNLKREILIKELNDCPILEAQTFYEGLFGKIFPKHKKSKAKTPLFLSLVITLGLGMLDNIPFYDYSIFMGIWLLSLYLFDYNKITVTSRVPTESRDV